MVEPRPGSRPLRRTAAALFGLVVLAFAVGPWSGSPAGAATSSSGASKAPLPVPNGFQVQATNGYTLDIIGEPPGKGAGGRMTVIAFAKGREVTYQAPATVTETSMRADLGPVGEIAVNFERSGKATSVPCGKRAVRFASGSWVGTIDFHGEEGYADAEATSAPGNIEYLLGSFCGSFTESSSGGPRKGAELFIRNPGLGPQLSVYKHHPGGAALISADLREYVEGISIDRVLRLVMPGRDFSYASNLRTADVTPPGPFFAGSARFALGKKAGQRWQGDLTVDMPGRSGVPLTGPLLRATLSPSE